MADIDVVRKRYRMGSLGSRSRPRGRGRAARALVALAGLLASVTAFASLATLSPAPAHASPVGTVSVVAGISDPAGIAAGPDGNLWFANTGNNSIGRITTAGVVSTFRANGIVSPESITGGPDGNLWFTNTGTYPGYADSAIGRITPTGVVTIYTDATITSPRGIANGPDGNVWFVNGDGSIGRITPAGSVSRFAATAVSRVAGITTGPDGNVWFASGPLPPGAIGRITPAGAVSAFTGANISVPFGIAPGPDGNLWFADHSSPADAIGRITPSGVASRFTGTGIKYPEAIVAGGDGNLWFTNNDLLHPSIGRITTAGAVSNYTATGISSPVGITAGPDGNVWFTNRGNASIGRITPAGVVTIFRGAAIDAPRDIAFGPDGNMWFTNQANDSIGMITPAGTVANITGPGIAAPSGIAAGPDGNLWFTNTAGTGSIGRMTPGGSITELTDASIHAPSGIAMGPDGNLWFTNSTTIGRVTPAGAISTYGDPGLARPLGITPGPDGNLWFANSLGNSIGRITPAGVVTLFPGASSPHAITAGPDGALWFTNAIPGGGNVGKITTSGIVTSFTTSGIVNPEGIAAGPDGNVWVAGSGDDSIGRLTPAGSFSRLTGPGVVGPRGIGASADGGVWFTANNAIGRVSASGPLVAPLPPASVLAKAGDGFAKVSWTPSPSVADALTGTTVTASPGGRTCTWSGGPRSCTVTGLTNGVSYTFSVRAADAGGAGSPSSPSNAVVPRPPTYLGVTPARLLETRTGPGLTTVDGQFQGGGPRPAGSVLALTVAGRAGVPSTVADVSLNVTVTGPSGPGFVTVYPCGATRPNASSLNFTAGQIVANTVIISVGTNEQVCLFTTTTTDLVVDVDGSFPSGSAYQGVTPARLLETRSGPGLATVDGQSQGIGAVPGGSVVAVTVAGRGGVPAGAVAASLNVTVTGPTGPGFVTVFPCGTAVPNVSNVNVVAGRVTPNAVVTRLGQGKVCLYTSVTTDLVVDVDGSFPTGSDFTALNPARLLETRTGPGLSTVDGQFQGGGARPGGSVLALTVANRAGVPTSAAAVSLNVTVTGPTGPGFLTAYPCTATRPNASNINFTAGQVVANAAIVRVRSGDQVCLFTTTTTDLVVDVNGWFACPTTSFSCTAVPNDYTGDGRADVVYQTTTDGMWHQVGVAQPLFTGLANDVPVPGDYDGDGRWEPTVLRGRDWVSAALPAPIHFDPPGLPTTPAYPTWTNATSGPTDGLLPVPADYDGTGITTPAYYALTDGTWWIMGHPGPVSFGIAPTSNGGLDYDVPVPADYDGDGKADLAIYRPSDGSFHIRPSAGGPEQVSVIDVRSAFPVPGDYDGDHAADPAVTNIAADTWYRAGSTTPFHTFTTAPVSEYFIPQPAEYTGDGAVDPAIVHIGGSSSTWEVAGLGVVGSASGNVMTTSLPPAVLDSIARLTLYDRCLHDLYWHQLYPTHCPPA